MSDATRQLLEQALQLPAPERAELAAQILASMNDTPDEDVETAWAAEIERRLSGDRSKDRPWTEVRTEVRAKFGYK